MSSRTHAQDGVKYSVTIMENTSGERELYLTVSEVDGEIPRYGWITLRAKIESPIKEKI